MKLIKIGNCTVINMEYVTDIMKVDFVIEAYYESGRVSRVRFETKEERDSAYEDVLKQIAVIV